MEKFPTVSLNTLTINLVTTNECIDVALKEGVKALPLPPLVLFNQEQANIYILCFIFPVSFVLWQMYESENLCLPESCIMFCVSVFVVSVPNKGLFYWTAQKASHVEGMMDTLQQF